MGDGSTRRDLLRGGAALLALSACDRPRAGSRQAASAREDQGHAQGAPPPQSRTPRLLFVGDRLAQLARDGLRIWHTDDWTSSILPLVNPCGLGQLSDDALAVMDQPPSTPGVVRLQSASPHGQVETWSGAVPFGETLTRITPGRPSEARLLHFGDDGSISRVHLDQDGSLLMIGFQTLPKGDSAVAMLEDQSLVYPWFGGLIRSGRRGCATFTVPGQDGAIAHVAAGRGEEVWLSVASIRLALVSLTDHARVRWELASDLPIFHLAASGDRVATLLLEQLPGQLQPAWHLAVYEAGRGERWRLPLPTPSSASETFVAMSEDLVAVGGSSSLAIFDADDGAVVRS